MKITLKSIFLLGFTLLFSCNNDAKINSKLDECYAESEKYLNDNLVGGFSIREFYKSFEELLVEKQQLNINDKQSYLLLLKKINNCNPEIVEVYNDSQKIKNFHTIQTPSQVYTPFNCVNYILSNNYLSDNEENRKYKEQFNNLFNSSNFKEENFIKSTPNKLFENFQFRVPILTILFFNLVEKNSIAIVTALNPHIGYKKSSAIAKEALASGKSVREITLEKGWLTTEQLDEILDPKNMLE